MVRATCNERKIKIIQQQRRYLIRDQSRSLQVLHWRPRRKCIRLELLNKQLLNNLIQAAAMSDQAAAVVFLSKMSNAITFSSFIKAILILYLSRSLLRLFAYCLYQLTVLLASVFSSILHQLPSVHPFSSSYYCIFLHF